MRKGKAKVKMDGRQDLKKLYNSRQNRESRQKLPCDNTAIIIVNLNSEHKFCFQSTTDFESFSNDEKNNYFSP